MGLRSIRGLDLALGLMAGASLGAAFATDSMKEVLRSVVVSGGGTPSHRSAGGLAHRKWRKRRSSGRA